MREWGGGGVRGREWGGRGWGCEGDLPVSEDGVALLEGDWRFAGAGSNLTLLAELLVQHGQLADIVLL